MARPPEVKEKEIIAVGLALELQGKIPNPGAIRAKLGFRGGLQRIRKVWDAHQSQGLGKALVHEEGLTFNELPGELADATTDLIEKQRYQFEQIVIHAYQRCQSIFERRLDESTRKFEETTNFYKDYEQDADESIQRLESELQALNLELNNLNKRNSYLQLENARLSGSLEVLNIAFPLMSSDAKGKEATK
jgi:hypothetical protein